MFALPDITHGPLLVIWLAALRKEKEKEKNGKVKTTPFGVLRSQVLDWTAQLAALKTYLIGLSALLERCLHVQVQRNACTLKYGSCTLPYMYTRAKDTSIWLWCTCSADSKMSVHNMQTCTTVCKQRCPA